MDDMGFLIFRLAIKQYPIEDEVANSDQFCEAWDAL
jgi:hypothetical protein